MPQTVDLAPRKHHSPRRRPVLLAVVFLLGLVAAGALGSPAAAEIGDVVHTIDRCGHGWFGGVAWVDGYVYESCKSADGDCAEIYKKHPVTGEIQQTLRVAVARPTYTNGIAYDSRRKCFWLAVGGDGIYQVDMSSGAVLSFFDPFHHPFGLYYDPQTDCLWIGDNVYYRIRIYKLGDISLLAEIDLDVLPTGIERIGQYLWVAEFGSSNPPIPGTIYRCTLDGQRTGVQFFLPFDHTYSDDVGGITFDGKYLWAKGGKGTALYKIDIAGPGPFPTPVATSPPVPTPAQPVLERTDYNGDGTIDPACFRAASGLWAVRGITRLVFGFSEDLPVPGDYDGSGTSRPAVFRPAQGLWAIRGLTQMFFGTAGDIPLAADIDRDGRSDPGVFRPDAGGWFIRGRSRFFFGSPGDDPLVGDFNGDGKMEFGVFRSADGLWAIRDGARIHLGGEEDAPVPADYFGGGVDFPAVFCRGSGLWATSSGHRIYLGSAGDQASPGDYGGTGAALPAVFRASRGEWTVYRLTRFVFGTAGDRAVTR